MSDGGFGCVSVIEIEIEMGFLTVTKGYPANRLLLYLGHVLFLFCWRWTNTTGRGEQASNLERDSESSKTAHIGQETNKDGPNG